MGLEQPEEIKYSEPLIYRNYFDWPLSFGRMKLSKKGTPMFSIHDVPYTLETPEKRKIAEEYNKKLDEFKKYKHEVFELLFKK